MNDDLQLISKAQLSDVWVTEGNSTRRVKPTDQKLFLFHVQSIFGNGLGVAISQVEFGKRTQLSGRFIRRVGKALSDAGCIEITEPKHGRYTYQILTQALKRTLPQDG